MTRTAQPVARLSSPGEIAAVLPHLCGFVPSESVVLLSLRGPRRRVGLVIRIDLGDPTRERQDADELVARLMTDAPQEVVLVVCTEQVGQWPRRNFVDKLQQVCRRAGVGTREALLVRDGRWFSYTCSSASCCPPEGTPIARFDASPALGLLAAEAVLAGRNVLADRAALERTLAPPQLLAAAAGERAVQTALQARAHSQLTQGGPAAVRAQGVTAWSDAVCAAAEGRLPHLAEAAALTAVLVDFSTRDEVLTWALDQAAALLVLLEHLASLVPAPWDVPICTMLAVTSWSRGDGAMANVALDRALAADADYGLARLARTGLDQALPPKEVRRWLRACVTG